MAQTRRRGSTSAPHLAPPEPPATLLREPKGFAVGLRTAVMHPAGQRVLCTLLLGLGFVATYRASLDYLTRDPRFQVAPASLELVAAPPWIPPEYKVAPVLPPGYEGGVSIFDPRLVEVIAASYARCPWIERVDRVEKRYPNTVRIAVALRRPVAAVACAPSGYCLVDAQAIRLPGRYEEPPHIGVQLPVIEGALAAPPPPGQTWRDQGVADGARLAYLWQDRGMLDVVDVRRIDVRNVGGRVDRRASEVVVYLASDTPLNWGRVSRAGRDDAIAVDDQQKLAILRSELVNSGMLKRDPQLAYVSYLDIQHGVLRIGRR